MRVVIQRVTSGSVTIGGKVHGTVGKGLVILLGITHDDTRDDADFLVSKCVNLRIFEDDAGKLNRSLLDIQGGILLISQFTLYGDARKGRRPSFDQAARPEIAEPLYNYFIDELKKIPVPVETGIFGADMKVEIHNDGPVTIIIDSP